MNKNKIIRKKKSLANRIEIIGEKAMVTFFAGLGCKILIGFLGFLIGTFAQKEDSIIHLKIDNTFCFLGNVVFGVAILITLIFAVKAYNLKGQRDILESIQ